MIARLLFDPNADGGGGGETTTTTQATAGAEKPAPIAVDPSEWQKVQDELATLRKGESDRQKAEREKAEAIARDKGKYDEIIKARDSDLAAKEKEIKDRDERFATLERETASSLTSKELATALATAGVDLIPGAAAQLLKLWRDDFEARRTGGEWVVQTRDGKAVADVVRSRLADAGYAHFVKAGSRGGAGSDATRTTETQQQEEAPIRNLGEALINVWKERAATPGNDYRTPRGFHGQVQK